jgi:hypothetical protein
MRRLASLALLLLATPAAAKDDCDYGRPCALLGSLVKASMMSGMTTSFRPGEPSLTR